MEQMECFQKNTIVTFIGETKFRCISEEKQSLRLRLSEKLSTYLCVTVKVAMCGNVHAFGKKVVLDAKKMSTLPCRQVSLRF